MADDITPHEIADHFLQVKVEGPQVKKVDTSIPLNLIKKAFRFGALSSTLIPKEVQVELHKKGFDLSSAEIKKLIQQVDEGAVTGKIVDVDLADSSKGPLHIEISVN